MKLNLKLSAEALKEKLGLKNGEPGKDGHTPTAPELKALIEPLIPSPIPGTPGSDGKTPTKTELRALMQPLIPEPKHGKDGSPDTGEEVIDKVNADKSKKKIKKEKVEGLDEFESRLKTVEVTPQGAWGGTHTIQDEGISKTFRSNLDFVGAGVTVTDDPANNATKVTIPGGGGAVTDVTATLPITSSGGATPDISTSLATNKLIGRGTAGTGVMEEITLGTNLSFTGTTLNVPTMTTAPGGSDTYVQFNDGGVFNGKSGFTFNKTTDVATLIGGINAPKITNLTTNGFVKTSGGNGTLGIDTNTYLTSLTGAVLVNGTAPLTADWDAGSFEIRAQTLESDVTTGTAPLTIASTTKVTNLNADLLDDQEGSYYLDAANFTGTNWTDLTDGGATTLHKHDHGGQDGLGDDDHTQYTLLAGRAGGQTILGGTAAGDDLTLNSTSNATKGDIFIASAGGNVTLGGGATASELKFLEPSGSGANYTALKAQAQAADITYTLPAAVGAAGTFLKDVAGNGTLSWATAGGVTFGTTTQIPHMNAGGTDFIYDASFVYDTSTNRLGVNTSTLNSSLNISGDINMQSANYKIGGTGVTAAGTGALSIGTDVVVAPGTNSLALGYYASANGNNCVAIGSGPTGTYVVAGEVGGAARAVAIGNGSQALGQGTVALGNSAVVSSGNVYCIAIGNSALTGSSANYSAALGAGAYCGGGAQVAIGFNAFVGNGKDSSVAIGREATIQHSSAVAIGLSATTTRNQQCMIGGTGAGSVLEVILNGGFAAWYVAKTANYTLTATDYTVDCTANSFTITLPTAVGCSGRVYNIKNSGTGTITIATTSSQTIDGNATATLTLAQYDCLTVQSNNANYIII